MSTPLSAGQKVALATAASIPSGYALLRWKYPTFFTEIRRLLRIRNVIKSATDYAIAGKTFVDLIEKHGQERPGHPCLLYENEMYTYAEVVWNVNRTARWISRSDPGLKKGDVVCMMMHNGPSFVWTWMGLMKLGVIVSQINYNLKRDGLVHCIRASDSNKMIIGSDFIDAICDVKQVLPELGIRVWIINDARLPGLIPPDGMTMMDISTVSGEPFKGATASARQPITYIFTSGTTGLPKPAIVVQAQLLSAAFLLPLISNMSIDDIFYVAMPMYHSGALLVALSATLGHGATLAIAKKFSASHFWDDIRKHNATMFQYIGEICRYLIAQPKKADDGVYNRPIRGAMGNGLQHDIWEEFQKRFNIGHIYEFYGATEAVSFFMNYDGYVGSVGKYTWLRKKLKDHLEIVDYDYDTGEPRRGKDGFCVRLPPGKPGLLLGKITDFATFSGYKGSTQMTDKKIIRDVKVKGDVYFNSGDLMRLDEDGHLYFIDRLGDTFRWKGENVSTQEVSFVIGKFPGVLLANVYGVKVPGHEGKAGMVAIIPRKGASLDLHALYEHVEASLPDYARPKFLRLVEEMDMTGTFKLRKMDMVKRGFSQGDGNGEVYIWEPAQRTYAPITQDHIRSLQAGQSKL